MRFHRLSLIVVAVLLLLGCNEGVRHQHRLYVFGTLVDITIYGVDAQTASAAVNAVATDFQRMHYQWHAWEPGPLTEVNDAIARSEAIEIEPSLRPLIARSRTLYEQSEGLFNPAIGGLVALWGFHSNERPNGPPPSRTAIARWLENAPGMDDISLSREGLLTSSNPQVQFDFGAFAKGYAVDLAIQRLREFGIENAIVNAGGDLRAIGSADGRPWRIGVRHPQGEGVLAAIDVEGDESVFTSGNYERYREHEGVRYAHILDPRTGMPVEEVASVTVIHRDGAVADAAATALVVAGVKGWQRIAKRMGMDKVLLVDSDGRVYMTPAMEGRVVFSQRPEIIIMDGVD